MAAVGLDETSFKAIAQVAIAQVAGPLIQGG
jgi:hypothetical protein